MRITVKDIRASEEFYALYGRYELSNSGWTIPYFSTTMTLQEAAENLSYATDIPGGDKEEWKVEELFQRQLDWYRVEHQILHYLRADAIPHFFSALTVAMLPAHVSDRLDDFSDARLVAPPLSCQQPPLHEMEVGPIRVGFEIPLPEGGGMCPSLSMVRWNLDQVYCVAIDGQHRLAAIKRYVNGLSRGHDSVKRTRVPVILIPLARSLGFRSSEANGGLITVLRRIFIDLNKHAQRPSRARQILLDDYDVQSRCVRALLGERLSPSLAELDGEAPGRLPLSLVDWHSEQARFDEGPYLATILGVDWIVSHILGIRHVQDPSDAVEVKRSLIEPLELQLSYCLPKAITDRVESLEEGGARPFALSPEEIGGVQARFATVWGKSVVCLLSMFRPYAHLIEARRQFRMDSVEFANWYSLYAQKLERSGSHVADELKKLEDTLRNRDVDPISCDMWVKQGLPHCNTLKQKEGLPYNVVFQRAVVQAVFDLARTEIESDLGNPENWADDEVSLFDEGEPFEQETLDALVGDEDEVGTRYLVRTSLCVEQLNRLYDSTGGALFTTDAKVVSESGSQLRMFWLGSLLKESDVIDFTAGAAKRASA